MQIDGVRLTRRPPSWQGQGDEVELTVTLENLSDVPAFVPTQVKDWHYDGATKTLTVDFTEPSPQARPALTNPSVSVGFPQHTFPLHAEVVEIAPHSKVDLKGARPVVITRYRMIDADHFATDQLDTSGVEHVTVILPADRTKFAPSGTKDVEEERSRFRAWGQKIEKTFEAKLK